VVKEGEEEETPIKGNNAHTAIRWTTLLKNVIQSMVIPHGINREEIKKEVTTMIKVATHNRHAT